MYWSSISEILYVPHTEEEYRQELVGLSYLIV